MPSTHVTLSTRLYYCLGTTLYCVSAKHRVGMFKTYFVCSEHTRVWIVSNCFWRSAALSLRRVSEHVGCAPEHGSCLLNIPITVGTPACNTEARMDHYCTGMGHWGGNSEISKKTAACRNSSDGQAVSEFLLGWQNSDPDRILQELGSLTQASIKP